MKILIPHMHGNYNYSTRYIYIYIYIPDIISKYFLVFMIISNCFIFQNTFFTILINICIAASYTLDSDYVLNSQTKEILL